jgi:hypothetical protein
LIPASGKAGANDNRHHNDASRLTRDRWFESGFLQRGVRCEPEFAAFEVVPFIPLRANLQPVRGNFCSTALNNCANSLTPPETPA